MEEQPSKKTPRRHIDRMLGIVGGGFILLDVCALLFLPTFSLASVITIATIAAACFGGGMIARATKKPTDKS